MEGFLQLLRKDMKMILSGRFFLLAFYRWFYIPAILILYM